MATILLFLVSRARAATYASRLDFTGTTLDCIKNSNLTGQVFYNHKTATCHAVEASWRGPFFTGEWGPLLCQQGPNDNRCLNWGYGCCTFCSQFASNAHGPEDFNLGKAFAPGEYLQTLTVDREVTTDDPTAPKPLDVTNNARFELAFSPTGFGNPASCAGQKAFAPPVLNPGDVWNITVVIPDVGQSVRMDKDEPGSGDGQEILAGTAPKPFKVIVTKKVNAGATVLALGGFDVVFRLKNSAGTQVGEPQTATTLADGRAQAAFPAQVPGTYTVEATCAGCAGGSPAVFAATIRTVAEVTELRRISGDQFGDVGQRLLNPLRVRAVNRITGKGEPGFNVIFERTSFPVGGEIAQVAPSSENTNPLGFRNATALLGSIEGEYRFRARCPSCTAGQQEVVFVVGARRPPIARNISAESTRRSYDSFGAPLGIPGHVALIFQTEMMASLGLSREYDSPLKRIGILEGDSLTFGALAYPPVAGFEAVWDPPSTSGASFTRRFDSAGDYHQAVSFRGLNMTATITVMSRPVANEVDVCLNRFVAPLCLVGFFNALAADRLIKPFKTGGCQARNDAVDAMRHTIWNALMTHDLGAEMATALGRAHEGSSLGSGNVTPHNAVVMDLENNAAGVTIGLQTALRSDLWPAVISARNAGGLVMMDDCDNGIRSASASESIETGAGLLEKTAP